MSTQFRPFTTAKANNTAAATPPPMIIACVLSDFWYRRTFACSSSLRVISGLLFHVPDHEDEAELGERDHEPDDDEEEGEDEIAAGLVDQGHDGHDDDEEEGEGDHDGDEGLGEHAERLHLLPHLQPVLLLVLLRLQLEVGLELAPAGRGGDHALKEVLELRRGGTQRGALD